MSVTTLSERIDGKVELLGVLAGVFLALFGITTIIGQPWATNSDMLAVVIRIIGALATTGIGAGMVWLSLETEK
jgi:uncharacterized membrane protein